MNIPITMVFVAMQPWQSIIRKVHNRLQSVTCHSHITAISYQQEFAATNMINMHAPEEKNIDYFLSSFAPAEKN